VSGSKERRNAGLRLQFASPPTPKLNWGGKATFWQQGTVLHYGGRKGTRIERKVGEKDTVLSVMYNESVRKRPAYMSQSEEGAGGISSWLFIECAGKIRWSKPTPRQEGRGKGQSPYKSHCAKPLPEQRRQEPRERTGGKTAKKDSKLYLFQDPLYPRHNGENIYETWALKEKERSSARTPACAD